MVDKKDINSRSGYRPLDKEDRVCYICGKNFLFTKTYINEKGGIWSVSGSETNPFICKNPICVKINDNTKEIRKTWFDIELAKQDQKTEINLIRYELKWQRRFIIGLPIVWFFLDILFRYVFPLVK